LTTDLSEHKKMILLCIYTSQKQIFGFSDDLEKAFAQILLNEESLA